jgi:hypothetical protein
MFPKRIGIKFFAANPQVADLPAFVPVFQRWIQQHAVEGLLIDVADYKHVPDGPGIVLIGHEGDYSYDLSEGRPGVQYIRKTPLHDSLASGIPALVRLALAAARQIEAEPSLNGLAFRCGEARITLLDRLRAPNTPEAWEAVQAEVQAPLASLYGDAPLRLARAYDDPRECLAISVHADGDFSAAGLLERLGKLAAEPV